MGLLFRIGSHRRTTFYTVQSEAAEAVGGCLGQRLKEELSQQPLFLTSGREAVQLEAALTVLPTELCSPR